MHTKVFLLQYNNEHSIVFSDRVKENLLHVFKYTIEKLILKLFDDKHIRSNSLKKIFTAVFNPSVPRVLKMTRLVIFSL